MKLNKDLNGKTAEFLKTYLKNHSMSQSAITAALGYKSITSVVRLLKGRVAYVAISDCLRRFADLPMSEEERKEYDLLCSDDISIIKHDQWIRVLNATSFDPDAKVTLINNRYRSMAERYQDVSNITVRMFGCVSSAVSAELARFLRAGANIRHFIRIEDQGRSTLSILDATLPLLFYKNYHSAMYDAGKNEPISGLTGGDVMMIAYKDASGVSRKEMVVLTDAAAGMIIPFTDEADADEIYLQACRQHKVVSLSSNRSENYGDDPAASLGYFLRLEQDVSIRQLKPDIGYDRIPAEILINAINEENTAKEKYAKLLPVMHAIMRKRWENTINAAYPHQIVVKRSAMEAFFRTGQLSDHFFMLRAFTVEERREILDSLIRSHETNKNLQLYFLKDDDVIADREVTLYGRSGLRFVKHHTDYKVTEEHAETIICRKRIMDSFSAFYDEALLGNMVCGIQESMDILHSFYSILDTL